MGEWKKGDPRMEIYIREVPKKKKKKNMSPHGLAALQKNTVTLWATPGITGSESENEGVKGEGETKVQ